MYRVFATIGGRKMEVSRERTQYEAGQVAAEYAITNPEARIWIKGPKNGGRRRNRWADDSYGAR